MHENQTFMGGKTNTLFPVFCQFRSIVGPWSGNASLEGLYPAMDHC